jgi:hypothetical protein
MACLGLIVATFLRNHEASIDAYKWSQISNDFYFGFNKMIFLAALLMIILSIFLGHANLAKHVFKNNYTRSFGKMAYVAGLASPIVITLLYFG